MKTEQLLTSVCRHCRYYKPEGRRGGTCQQLGVLVQGKWSACSLAAHPFSSNWNNIEQMIVLETSLSLQYAENPSSLAVSDSEIAVTS